MILLFIIKYHLLRNLELHQLNIEIKVNKIFINVNLIQKFEKIVIIYIGGENMSVVPYVVQQTGNGERSYDIFSRLLCDRIIFLGEEVTDASASVVIAQLLF